MKRCRLSYDEWKCIISKEMSGKRVKTDFFEGYLGLIKILRVSEVQKWKIRGEEIVVCDIGRENDSTESFTCDMHGDENAKTRFEM